ncbi:MAG: Origin recognition complex subunit 2 Orc2 [Acidilobaceae archaeon]|nr:Origin recognition complex subunit 2 Orc2 [Acidilobaceae archaeon]
MIFRDRLVFDESYRPRRLLVRGQEASMLISRYRSRLADMAGFTDVSLIYGSIGRVGIGKTTVAWYVGKNVEEMARANGINLKYVYLNVFGAPSLHQILSVIADQLGLGVSIRGSSAIEALKFIVDHLYRRDTFLLVTLDEFQSLLLSPKMPEDDLYMLLRVYEEIPSKDGINRISFLLVASDHRVMAYMRERIPQVESQIGFRVHLKAYTSEELKIILRQRAEEGLEPEAWDDRLINMIAEYFGDDKGGDGSARKAILTLRSAAELAEAQGAHRILEEHVRKAISESALSYVPIEDLRRLPQHHLFILLALAELGIERGDWGTTGELREKYEEVCERYGQAPRGHTQFHSYLRELSTLGLIELRLSGKGMRGRTSLMRLPPEIPLDRMKEVLEAVIKEKGGEDWS